MEKLCRVQKRMQIFNFCQNTQNYKSIKSQTKRENGGGTETERGERNKRV